MFLRKIYLFIFFGFICLSTSISKAQPHIISSKEGFTNVRISASAKSKIIAKLKENTIILLDEIDEGSENEDWKKILFYNERPFSILEETDHIEMETGFIHKSQMKDLTALKKPNSGAFSMDFEIKAFQNQDYTLTFHEESSYAPKSINGFHYYLADCGLPKTAIIKATATLNGQKILIPQKYVLGIISAQNNFEYYQNGNHYFAYQGVGDGSCFNYVVWVFSDGKLSQRFVGWEY